MASPIYTGVNPVEDIINFTDNSSIVGIGPLNTAHDNPIYEVDDPNGGKENMGVNYVSNIRELFNVTNNSELNNGNASVEQPNAIVDGVNGVTGFYRDFFVTREIDRCRGIYNINDNDEFEFKEFDKDLSTGKIKYDESNNIVYKSDTAIQTLLTQPKPITQMNASEVEPFDVAYQYAYILMPKIYTKRIKISPTLIMDTTITSPIGPQGEVGEITTLINARYVFELLQDENFRDLYEEIIIDSVEYVLIKTAAKCHKVRLYYIASE